MLLQDNCFCKAMTVSQAFIFQFKCYHILHFAICQLLCWAYLFYLFEQCMSIFNSPIVWSRNITNSIVHIFTTYFYEDNWSLLLILLFITICRTLYSSPLDCASTSVYWPCAWVTMSYTCAVASPTPLRCSR